MRANGKTQTQVAALMHTSPAIVSRLESGHDVRVSTLEKYVAATSCPDIRDPRRRGPGRSVGSHPHTLSYPPMPTATPKIELIYDPDCPNVERARERLC